MHARTHCSHYIILHSAIHERYSRRLYSITDCLATTAKHSLSKHLLNQQKKAYKFSIAADAGEQVVACCSTPASISPSSSALGALGQEKPALYSTVHRDTGEMLSGCRHRDWKPPPPTPKCVYSRVPRRERNLNVFHRRPSMLSGRT